MVNGLGGTSMGTMRPEAVAMTQKEKLEPIFSMQYWRQGGMGERCS